MEVGICIWQVILGAHVLHLLLLGDFGYYYVKHLAVQIACFITRHAEMILIIPLLGPV